MGSIQSKNKDNPCEKEVKHLREKVKFLERGMGEIMRMRESESEGHEQERMIHGLKEAEWRRERKRLRGDVKKLRKRGEEREEDDQMVLLGEKREKEQWWCLVEQMREERERRDEAVEKWKRLYLAIKVELDELIRRTHQGERLYWRAEEEDLVEELQQELKTKEEAIEILKARLASMEQEQSKREREVDIVRQSLKIISHNKQKPIIVANAKSLSRKKLACAKHK
ncbi:hypothetical protein CEY00_Acc24194 [Actinidia chinensis var. chinensis]|uniref:Uncharacterized protein n=1 Tax=Actinidia chinensis var. chinensis TaxID=1590841 RepID=A0A2R6Q1E6_ACTCC|nr:hypothetical protein CEY00_Acc24194 [Actinidia chinensis var. chinensis]